MKINAAIDSLAALAQESRLRLFRALVRAGPEGLPAGAIASRLKVPPSTLSFHLGQLERCGLIRRKRAGRRLIYSVDFAVMSALIAYLGEDCCAGRPELCLSATFAERREETA